MKKNIAKISALAACLIFLLTIGNSAIAIELNSVKENETVSKNVVTRTVTVYRHGLNGEVEPIEVTLDISADEDLIDAINDKCEELFEKDIEIQTYISKAKNNNSTVNYGLGLYRIKSKGKGFHFKTKLLVKIVTKIVLLKLKLPHIRVNYKRKTIFCRYKNDEKAQTNITPIISLIGNKNNTGIKGNHSILVRNFRGYTTWLGRFAFTPILPRSFCGIGTSYIVKQ